jgi:Fe-S-cluster containining protein
MIKQLVPQEACLACQGCCRFAQEDSAWVPSLLNEEIEHFLNQGFIAAVINPHKKLKIVPFPKQKVYLCPLFDYENNKCKVYDSRPLECRLYPFLICAKDGFGAPDTNVADAGVGRTRKIYLAADYNCPFLKEKQMTGEFKEYTQYLVSLLQNPPYAELLRNNPHIMQSYAEASEIQELSL